MIFEVVNIECQNCANTIKNALCDDFGDISIDFSFNPRRLSVELKDDEIEAFKDALSDLGFEVLGQIKP